MSPEPGSREDSAGVSGTVMEVQRAFSCLIPSIHTILFAKQIRDINLPLSLSLAATISLSSLSSVYQPGLTNITLFLHPLSPLFFPTLYLCITPDPHKHYISAYL